ncbi:MAG: hypothetical protein JJW00_00180 [Sulfurimonas sp.]|nr:hypothetical protein [Sulfurimonas sp.]
MPQIIYTIDEYVTNIRKRDTFWIVFNTVYNDVHAFKEELGGREHLDEENTDFDEQKRFLDFMRENFADVKILKVFDLVSAGYIIYPYLGSYAIDIDKGDKCYEALAKRYNDPYEDATRNNAVLWMIDYENAKKFHKYREDMIEGEF